MDRDVNSKPKESVHIRVDKELYDKLEGLRKSSHSKIPLPRSVIYEETLFFGEKIQEIKKELGSKEFDRVWHWLNKLNLEKINLDKII